MKLYNRSTIYHLVPITFGPESQPLKLMEKAAGLAAAARNINIQANEADLAGELAAVEILIEQFRSKGPELLLELAQHTTETVREIIDMKPDVANRMMQI